MIDLEIINETKTKISRKKIEDWLVSIEAEFRKRKISVPNELTVSFISVARMKKVNSEFKNKKYATDILSFSLSSSVAELVLCPEVLKRNSKKKDMALPKIPWNFSRELELILLHGMLHLSGMDHSDQAASDESMMQLQSKIFLKLKKF